MRSVFTHRAALVSLVHALFCPGTRSLALDSERYPHRNCDDSCDCHATCRTLKSLFLYGANSIGRRACYKVSACTCARQMSTLAVFCVLFPAAGGGVGGGGSGKRSHQQEEQLRQ